MLIDDIDATLLDAADASSLRRAKIGTVFQQSNLLPALTALEQPEAMNELGSRHSRRNRARATWRAGDLLAAVGLRVHAASGHTSCPAASGSASILDLAGELTTSTLFVTHDLVHLPRMHAVMHLVDGSLGSQLTAAT